MAVTVQRPSAVNHGVTDSSRVALIMPFWSEVTGAVYGRSSGVMLLAGPALG